MWQPTWNGHAFSECPQSPSLGSPLGQHPGVLQCGGCGGCSPPVHPMRPQLSPCGPLWTLVTSRTRSLASSQFDDGTNSGCHRPGVSGPRAVNPHQGQDPAPSPTPSTPMPNSGLDISQLEERLGEAINKKFESMTETLRASMSTSMENSSKMAANASAKAPGPGISSEPVPPMPNASDGTTVTLPASATLEAEHSDRPSMLTSKAKPPARPEETRPSRSTMVSSRQRSVPRRSRDRKLSPSSSSHTKSLHRRRAHSDRHYQGSTI